MADVQINLWPDELRRPEKKPNRLPPSPPSANQPNKAVNGRIVHSNSSPIIGQVASIIGQKVRDLFHTLEQCSHWKRGGAGVGADIHQAKTKVFSARLNTNLVLKVGDWRLTPAPSNIRPIAGRMNGTRQKMEDTSTDHWLFLC